MSNETEKELFDEVRNQISEHCVRERGIILNETEIHDIWSVAFVSSRREIQRLERLLAHVAGSRTPIG